MKKQIQPVRIHPLARTFMLLHPVLTGYTHSHLYH